MNRFIVGAFRQALASLRVRFRRQSITTAGIALSIAFFTGVRTAGAEPGAESKLVWMTALSLLMCLVGVTNSMLMSVAERYREIGTFKCLGASDGFIVTVFLMEALLIGIIGSALGGFLGAGLTAVALNRPFSIELILIAVGIGLGLTLVAALIPAVQAARMPAAAALRSEA